MYDLLKASDGLIGHGTGNINVNGRKISPLLQPAALLTARAVQFRMIVFRPFKNEILTGRITRCTSEGIRSWFFSQHCKQHLLIFPSIDAILRRHLRACNHAFRWHLLVSTISFNSKPPDSHPTRSDVNEETWIWPLEDTESDALFLDVGEIVNFRVEKEIWHDQAPAPPKVTRPEEPEADPAADRRIPYSIEVSELVCVDSG